MGRFFGWYLPQAFLFAWGYWFASTLTDPQIGGPGKLVFALLLPAAYTGAINLAMDLAGRWRRRRAAGQESLSDDFLRSRPLPRE